jgi:hypothetical protein
MSECLSAGILKKFKHSGIQAFKYYLLNFTFPPLNQSYIQHTIPFSKKTNLN